jgi:hypothetical protein
LRAVFRNIFERYHRATVDKKGRVSGVNKFISEGLVGVMAHQIAEALNDGHIDTLSEPHSKGRQWLIEVADPVAGSFLKWTDPVRDIDVVFAGHHLQVVLPKGWHRAVLSGSWSL